jgi:hypothetical protein
MLWSGMVAPRVINLLLLPGTIVAQVGHITGVLLTGGSKEDVKKVIAIDTSGTPADKGIGNDGHILATTIVALVPMLACGICLYIIMMMSRTGTAMLVAAGVDRANLTLPTSVPAFWEWLRNAIGLVESASHALFSVDYDQLDAWLFVYLLTCMTVRLAPLPGTQRGAVVGILIIGLLAFVTSLFSPVAHETVERLWNLGSFATATLLFILILSLTLRASVGLFKIIANR